MLKIYTYEAYMRLIGGYPIIYIDDDGLIYSSEEYNKTIGRAPCGKVDFENGRVYGSDYNDYVRSPVAEFTRSGNQIAVYKAPRPMVSSPILYVENNKIYEPDQYHMIAGRQSCGYVQTVADLGGVLKDDGGSGGDSSGGGGAGCSLPLWGLAVAALAIWFVLRTLKFMTIDMTGMGASVIACILFSILTVKIGPVKHLEKNPTAVAQCKAKAANAAAIVALVCGALWGLTIYQWFNNSGQRTDLLLLLLAGAVVFTGASFFTGKQYFYRRYLKQSGGQPGAAGTSRKTPPFKARTTVHTPKVEKQQPDKTAFKDVDWLNNVFAVKGTVRCPHCGAKSKCDIKGADSGAVTCYRCKNSFYVKDRF